MNRNLLVRDLAKKEVDKIHKLEAIKIPARKEVRLSVDKALKNSVNKK